MKHSVRVAGGVRGQRGLREGEQVPELGVALPDESAWGEGGRERREGRC